MRISNAFVTTKKQLLGAIAAPIGLQLGGLRTIPLADGSYKVELHTKLNSAHLAGHTNEPKIFSSQSTKILGYAEEDVCMQALQFYFGEPAIPVLEYLYRSSLTAQQLAHDHQRDHNNIAVLVQRQSAVIKVLETTAQKLRYDLTKANSGK